MLPVKDYVKMERLKPQAVEDRLYQRRIIETARHRNTLLFCQQPCSAMRNSFSNAHLSSSPRMRYTKREVERLIEYAEKYSSSVKVSFPKFNRQDVIKEVGRRAFELGERLGLERVILFGSYAKGNYTVASDIDLLVIFDDERISWDEVYRCLMKSIQLPMLELHLIPKKDLKAYETSTWMKIIEKEGVKIL